MRFDTKTSRCAAWAGQNIIIVRRNTTIQVKPTDGAALETSGRHFDKRLCQEATGHEEPTKNRANIGYMCIGGGCLLPGLAARLAATSRKPRAARDGPASPQTMYCLDADNIPHAAYKQVTVHM